MTSKTIKKSASLMFASLAVLLSCSVLAENSSGTYEYGVALDVVRVLSVTTQKTALCKPVDHLMKYIDSAGKTKTLKYRALSDACSKGH